MSERLLELVEEKIRKLESELSEWKKEKSRLLKSESSARPKITRKRPLSEESIAGRAKKLIHNKGATMSVEELTEELKVPAKELFGSVGKYAREQRHFFRDKEGRFGLIEWEKNEPIEK